MKFVPAYPSQDWKAAFRCFRYESGGEMHISWGFLLMRLPAAFTLSATVWIFYCPEDHIQAPDSTFPLTRFQTLSQTRDGSTALSVSAKVRTLGSSNMERWSPGTS